MMDRSVGIAGCLCGCLVLFFSLASLPVCSEPLPNPLTLSQALSYANAGQPELALADAGLAIAMSRREQVEADNSLDAYIELAPYMAIPSPQYNEDFTNDSYARFAVTKKLFDFGYSDSLQNSAEESILSQELIAAEARNWNYLKIMRLFFNVVIADMHFAAANETMATRYVRYDKLLESHSLGMVSDVTLAQAESRYRESADRRKQSEVQQYTSRQQLAIALNLPDKLPADLVKPALPQLDRAIPELNDLLDAVYTNNLKLKSLEHGVRSASAALEAARQQHGPTLSAGMELNHYERRLPGRNAASVGVTLNIPLTDGYQSRGEVARLTAALSASQASVENQRLQLRQQLVDLISRLEILHYKRNSDKIRLGSRELNLEKNRAAYELEMQTTLGTSMADYTEAEWLSAKNDFEIALTWAQIDILSGKKLYLETQD